MNLLNWLESIGRTVINGLSQMGSATLLVWHTIKQLKMINLWHVFSADGSPRGGLIADYKFDVALSQARL